MPDRYIRPNWFTTNVFNRLVALSTRLGISVYGSRVLAVRGRKSGELRTVPVNLLDYQGETQELGKNVGDDLREGKPTLPLLVAMERGTPQQRALIRHAIEHGEVQRLAEIVTIVRDTGALELTREAARTEADKARQCAHRLPASIYREALLELCFRSVDRSA